MILTRLPLPSVPRFSAARRRLARSRLALFAGIALLSPGGPASAANPRADHEYYARTWDTDDGIAYNWIKDIVQDARGFLWLGTNGGLTRYDGHEFKEIKLPREFRTNGLNIRGLALEDPRTLLLLSTGNDVIRLQDGKFSLHPASQAVAGKQPNELFVEPGGGLWLGLLDGTLLHWKNGRAEWFGPADGIDQRVGRFTFATGANGETWIATGRFLARYRDGRLLPFETGSGEPLMIASGSKGRLWICTPTELRELADGQLRTISRAVPWQDTLLTMQHHFEDDAGLVWFAVGRLGVYCWDGSTFRHIETPTPAKFIMKDAEGNVWVATAGNGLMQLRQKTYRLFDSSSGLAENASTSVHTSADGTVWVANNGGGVARLHNNQMEPLHLGYAGQPLRLNTVCTDQAGNLWCAGPDGLFLAPLPVAGEPRKMPGPAQNVHLLFPSRRGDMWFATDPPGQLGYYRDGVPRLLTAAEGYTGQIIKTIAEDNSGTIWLGTLKGDLLRFADGHMTVFAEESGVPQQTIQDLFVDGAGDLWVATTGGLLLRQGNRFHLFTQADGLADEMIGRILEDERGLLWFISRSGIYFAEKKDLLALARGEAGRITSYRYGRNQGLTGVTPMVNYQPSTARTRDGHLLFATAKGVVMLDPSGVELGSAPPGVTIDEVRVDNVPVPMQPGIEFPAGRHRIEFRFVAPSFAFEKVQFNHKLEGADPSWVETSETNLASYSGLAAGNYRLHVRVRNGMGEWSPVPATLGFTVQSAWWQNLWLAFAIVAGIVAGTAGGVRTWSQRVLRQRLRRLEQENALEKERARIARNLHDELGGSLTQIGLLADRLRHTPARDLPPALSRLSAHTRQLHVELSSIIWTVSPTNNSLDRLAGFLPRYAGRFFRHSAITCRVEGVHAIPPYPLSPDAQHHLLAIAKEALNNVLSHSGATTVLIRTECRDDGFHLVVEDNGIGFVVDALDENQGNGLNNMRERAIELGGTLQITSAIGNGTRLTLIYPCGPVVAPVPPQLVPGPS